MKKSKKLIFIVLFLVMILQLTACSGPRAFIDRAGKIEKIEVLKRSTQETVVLDNKDDISALVSEFEGASVVRKSFSETWNSMGGSSPTYTYYYSVKVTTKDSLFSKSEEYTVVVGREYMSSGSKVIENNYIRRVTKEGTMSSSGAQYISNLFNG